jgi:molybdopterin-containing oxidoreductase family iron-sulfur binding subunit
MGETDSHNPAATTGNQHGPAYWRSLDEYANSAEFRRRLANEFPDYDPQQLQALSRRRFMQLAGASMALAGLTLSGCRRWPKEQVAPYTSRPEGAVPGETEQYATVFEQGGVGQGLLATGFDGRPIKLEGNKQHPISNGATDQFAQASILQLYDPDRSRGVVEGVGEQATRRDWASFNEFASAHFNARAGQNSAGVAVLAEPSSSATRAALRRAFYERFPKAGWYEYEPINRDQEVEGLRRAFGQSVRPQYSLDQATVIACFDEDLLSAHPAALKHARDWAKGRRSADEGVMNRLYAAESRFTTTGTNADHRLAVPSSEIPGLIRALAARLGVAGDADAGDLNGASAFIETLAKDLKATGSKAVVTVGPNQPAEVHTLVAAINDSLGAVGTTLTYTKEPLVGDRDLTQQASLADLAGRIEAGEIETLVILGANPVYNTPADVDFAGLIQQMNERGTTIHLGLYYDETGIASHWHLPRAHYLEAWGDAQSWDGTRSIQQPVIQPLFDGKTPEEVLATITAQPVTQSYDLVRSTFQRQKLVGTDNFESNWRQALHAGVVADSAMKPIEVSVQGKAVQSALNAPATQPKQGGGKASGGFEVTFNRDESVADGRFANNGWLQELPDPVTKMTWDNPALINIADAKQHGLKTGDMVTLTIGDRSLELPVYLCPGQARGSIAVKLGYGRTQAGHVGGTPDSSVGFDTYQLRGTNAAWVATGASMKPAGGSYALASTQNHHLIDQNAQWGRRVRTGEKASPDGRRGGEANPASGKIIREASLDYYKAHPDFAFEQGPHAAGVKSRKDVPLQIYQPPSKGGQDWPDATWQTDQAKAPSVFNEPHAWGMTIDMNSCLGCNACVVACQAENNIPVVGKDEVLSGREMQWIRIDRYFKTDPGKDPDGEDPSVVHQPMMCVHCENAPCEQVCPVAATVHDTEGLNVMVYNRCIGTRYCSNNCPYKVRRFNYFDYHSKDTRGSAKPWLGMPDSQQQSAVNEIKRMVYNPDVSVRMRGVMEKCTYCVQRIKGKEIQARNEYAQRQGRDQSAEAGEFWHVDERGNVVLDDGAVETACQAACPTEAIKFGNLNDKDSEVAQAQRNNRAFGVLTELNTRPRTMHLAKIRNFAAV